ncbi:sterol desaturase family protein [Aestuariicella hydrocarbonica]|uniref:Sterol desaturase family protein n=1 Tax=Pseudomaricurvus hydrocarbonicus TaxID=1470433 RepID=A0A9E5JSJ1_9GAMM|nr:sterol desaturase family protein [Aestuariicella hydrocarbonica]NHO65988.1 sterol desaturase family protein [Aestuariicella hydrocarbonica]
MDTTFFSTLAADYEGWLSLIMAVCVMGIPFLSSKVLTHFGVFKEISDLNHSVVEQKSTKPHWVKNQAWNRKWGLVFTAVIYVCIIPFVITDAPQVWWKYLVDIVVILMVYDFFYYLTHRFLFHDGGPLVWVHAVHHQQKDPCRMDSSYIHPLEVAMGLGLYVGTVFGLSFIMGDFHIVTLILTWIAFSEINLHNHDRQNSDRFPFKYLKHASDMHHIHHSRFTSGNFATISLFYDWLFGTLDTGDGWGKNKNAS